ncbi:hypothetical protein C7999DRAFT_36823 [Corynascus novoguineensis]|uniref:BZIP domain-containing protein n=1 Tax=Corynascus novoguineensis TaxID=1126955 RepID=A0AAN7HPH3_9PEZI|nr:hypothetical protein C7999DRAFT_36823 [Corynascus novoguineensis]
MSQGDSAHHRVSGHSVRSPTRATHATSSTPPQQSRAHEDELRARSLRDSSGFPQNQGEGGSRDLDTRGIFNPAGLHELSPSLSHTSTVGGTAQPGMGISQYGPEGSPSLPYAYQAPSATTPRLKTQTVPPTASPPGPPMLTDQGSPQPAHPYPMAARRILTPKSPRATNLSRAAMRTMEAQYLSTSLPSPMSRGAITGHDAQTHGNGNSPLGPGSMVPTSARPTSSLSRSASHPSLSHGLPPAPPAEQPQQGSLKREHSGRPVLSGLPFAAPLQKTQPFGVSGGGPHGETRWGPGIIGSMPVGPTRSLSMTDGQPHLTITPRHGEEIVVPVDVHQGSKQADQKRQRNAGASARFRQRKKEREREQQEELHKLENENRELEKKNEELARRCQGLESDLEFYRNSRSRLRDILNQIPGGKEWLDREPPSPIPRTTGGGTSAPDSNTMLSHQQPPPPPQNHSQTRHQSASFYQPPAHPLAPTHPRSNSYGDASALEPPARRRRTDSEPQLPTSSYSLLTTPTTLPPITAPAPPVHPPSFGIPPSPHITPPLGAARLPPLRFDRARTPSTTPPPLPTVPPPPPLAVPPQRAGSPYVSTRRLPYETGWATDPRSETDGGPR